MHGGLIYIALRLSVCDLTKIQTRKKFTRKKFISRKWLEFFEITRFLTIPTAGGAKSLSHATGRCALFNVKLHFLQWTLGLVEKNT